MKPYAVHFTKSAAKDIYQLDQRLRRTVQRAVDRLAKDPNLGKPLRKEMKGLYSYRVTSFRIIYKIVRGRLEIVIIAIGHRKNIYERLKRVLTEM